MIDRLIDSFIGITIGENSNEDSGICVVNNKNELIRMDKAYSMDELTNCVKNLAGKYNSVICIDMPDYYEMLNGKWKLEAKLYHPLKVGGEFAAREGWDKRFSDRGKDFCKKLSAEGYEIYRYSSNYMATALNIKPYMKNNTPAGCKFLNMAIKEKLKIQNLPNNMLPLSVLEAILGAYLAKIIATGQEGVDYVFNGQFKDIKIAGLLPI